VKPERGRQISDLPAAGYCRFLVKIEIGFEGTYPPDEGKEELSSGCKKRRLFAK
jgi:hypothetical protein